MAALAQANHGPAIAYGGDEWTKKAIELFQKHFSPNAEPFIVFNGTGANVCAFKQMLRPWQAILCPESAHITTDECGAPQANTGCTLLTIATENGKLTPELCLSRLHGLGSQHHVQPAAVSISQSTECGTLYTLEELKQLAAFAKHHNLLFFMDGARACNAAAALRLTLKEMTTDIGVDILSFGGTKNGLMGAEAILFLKPHISHNFQFVRKQQMQLASKMRYLSAQFVALLENDLWHRNASHANKMAQYFVAQLKTHCPHLSLLYPVQANALFVKLPPSTLAAIRKKHLFWTWDEHNSIVRWMTSWDTQPEQIDRFIADLKASTR